jgi:hypothetical protein
MQGYAHAHAQPANGVTELVHPEGSMLEPWPLACSSLVLLHCELAQPCQAAVSMPANMLLQADIHATG